MEKSDLMGGERKKAEEKTRNVNLRSIGGPEIEERKKRKIEKMIKKERD